MGRRQVIVVWFWHFCWEIYFLMRRDSPSSRLLMVSQHMISIWAPRVVLVYLRVRERVICRDTQHRNWRSSTWVWMIGIGTLRTPTTKSPKPARIISLVSTVWTASLMPFISVITQRVWVRRWLGRVMLGVMQTHLEQWLDKSLVPSMVPTLTSLNCTRRSVSLISSKVCHVHISSSLKVNLNNCSERIDQAILY
jgi:hypothetical protein